jgi:hypothetical protein
MARIGWIHHRLQVWQRWVLTRGGGKLGYAAVDLLSPAHGDVQASAIVPADAVEASQTHDAVMQLPRELLVTVVEYYIGPGDERRKCERLAVHKATLHSRLERADGLLVSLLEDATRAWQPEQAQASMVEFVDRLELLVGGALIADAIEAPDLVATVEELRLRRVASDSEGGFTD